MYLSLSRYIYIYIYMIIGSRRTSAKTPFVPTPSDYVYAEAVRRYQ